MKTACALVFLFVLASGFTNRKGIDFFDGSFSQALALSKQTGKPIFIDFYATWCGPCKQLKKSFRDAEVGNYYNKNFVALSINGEKGEGPALMRRYGVNSYPTLLIIDGNGKPLARGSGYMKPYILVNFGRRVVPNQ